MVDGDDAAAVGSVDRTGGPVWCRCGLWSRGDGEVGGIGRSACSAPTRAAAPTVRPAVCAALPTTPTGGRVVGVGIREIGGPFEGEGLERSRAFTIAVDGRGPVSLAPCLHPPARQILVSHLSYCPSPPPKLLLDANRGMLKLFENPAGLKADGERCAWSSGSNGVIDPPAEDPATEYESPGDGMRQYESLAASIISSMRVRSSAVKREGWLDRQTPNQEVEDRLDGSSGGLEGDARWE